MIHDFILPPEFPDQSYLGLYNNPAPVDCLACPEVQSVGLLVGKAKRGNLNNNNSNTLQTVGRKQEENKTLTTILVRQKGTFF